MKYLMNCGIFLLLALNAHAEYKYGKFKLPGLAHKIWRCTNCDKKITLEFDDNDFTGSLTINGNDESAGTIHFKWMEATKCEQVWWYKSATLNNSLVCYVELVSTSSTIQNKWANWDTLNVLFSCNYTGDGGSKPLVLQGLNLWKFETNSSVSGCPGKETSCGNTALVDCKKYKDLIKRGKEFEEKGDYNSAIRSYSEAYKLEPLLPSDCEKEDLETMIAEAQGAKANGAPTKKIKSTASGKGKSKGTEGNSNGWAYMPDAEFANWLKRVQTTGNDMCSQFKQIMAAAGRGEMPSNPEAIEQNSNKLAAIYKELTEKKYMLSDEQQERMNTVLNQFQECVTGAVGATGAETGSMGSMIPSFTPPRPIPLGDESAGTANSQGSSSSSENHSNSTVQGTGLGDIGPQCKPGSPGYKRKTKK